MYVEGLRLHYTEQGSGQPLVLLHGSPGTLHDFPPELCNALGKNFRVIALDRPGYGQSEAPAFAATAYTQLRLLRSALRQLNAERPVLAAHSWGALPALIWALEAPEELHSIALISGGWLYPGAAHLPRSLRLAQLPAAGPAAAALFSIPVRRAVLRKVLCMAFAPGHVPLHALNTALKQWLRTPAQWRVFAQENYSALHLLPELSAHYASLKLPLLLITGNADKILNPAEHTYPLMEDVQQASLVLLDGEGHEPALSCPELVVEALERALLPGRQPLPRQCTLMSHERQKARSLVMQHGWNVAAYQALNPAFERWYNAEQNSLVCYTLKLGVRVVAGAPICAPERLLETTEEFERDAKAAGEKVCYFGVSERLCSVMERSGGRQRLKIGAQPCWNPAEWEQMIRKRSSLRAQIARARNKGVHVQEWPVQPVPRRQELEACRKKRESSRLAPPLHFLTEAVPLDQLHDRRLFVALRDGSIAGYLIATPVPERKGWLLEQIVRDMNAPNGTAELLADAANRVFAAESAQMVTPGMAPLARRAGEIELSARWMRFLLQWLRAHGRRFYNFEGLEAFKARFQPDDWEPVYLLGMGECVRFRFLLAVAAAFCDGPLLWVVLKTLAAAARQEVRSVVKTLRTRGH